MPGFGIGENGRNPGIANTNDTWWSIKVSLGRRCSRTSPTLTTILSIGRWTTRTAAVEWSASGGAWVWCFFTAGLRVLCRCNFGRRVRPALVFFVDSVLIKYDGKWQYALYLQLTMAKCLNYEIQIYFKCLSGATSSFTVVTFSSLCACVSLSDSCFWSLLCVCQIFLITCPVFLFFAVCLWKFCQNPLKVAFFGLLHVLNKSLVSIVKWHVTLPVSYTHLTLPTILRV